MTGRAVSLHTNIVSIGYRLRELRQELDLSTRQLARLAGVSYPTISRIENGHDDPQWSTIEKLLQALGHTTRFERRQDFTRLAELVDARHRDGEPDWTLLRGFIDQIELRPELAAAATCDRPLPTGAPVFDNILAAIAEKVADDAGLRPALWTAAVEPLEDVWLPPGTPRRLADARTRTAPEFLARNIVLPTDALWRHRSKVPN